MLNLQTIIQRYKTSISEISGLLAEDLVRLLRDANTDTNLVLASPIFDLPTNSHIIGSYLTHPIYCKIVNNTLTFHTDYIRFTSYWIQNRYAILVNSTVNSYQTTKKRKEYSIYFNGTAYVLPNHICNNIVRIMKSYSRAQTMYKKREVTNKKSCEDQIAKYKTK